MLDSQIRAEQPILLPPALAFAAGTRMAPRSAVEALIQKLVDELDTIDGDADSEDDERAGLPMVADGVDFVDEPTFLDGLAGSPEDAEDDDPDGFDGTELGDISWPEWHTRGRFKLFHEHESPGYGLGGIQLREDDEDDDPDTAVDDDTEANGDEKDTNNAEDESLIGGHYFPSGPGCVISDSDRGDE